MSDTGQARRLMIILDEDRRGSHGPLFLEVVQRARDAGLAGASVFRGIEGFGRSRQIRTTRILSLAEGVPVMIVIVDSAGRIDGFLRELEDVQLGGMVAYDDVVVASMPAPGSPDR